jgi:hypothetical protein
MLQHNHFCCSADVSTVLIRISYYGLMCQLCDLGRMDQHDAWVGGSAALVGQAEYRHVNPGMTRVVPNVGVLSFAVY